MSLSSEVNNLATRIGTEAKALRTFINGNLSDLSTLTTTNKASLIAAINEVDAASGGGGVSIDDAATNLVDAWSSTKIDTEISSEATARDVAIAAAVATLIGGAGASDDTLAELAAQIAANAAADANLVSVAGVQSFTTPQKLQARQNIDAASATDVGTTTTNYVTTFNTALV